MVAPVPLPIDLGLALAWLPQEYPDPPRGWWLRLWDAVVNQFDQSPGIVPLLIATISIALFGLWMARRNRERADGGRLGRQLALVFLVFTALLLVLLLAPMDPETKAQMVQVLGVVLPAAVALSSTALLGNAIGGIVLQRTADFQLGDFIEVSGHFGRVSERNLMNTEIQTADRDLINLPNLMLVTQPVRVLRRSGTVVSATCSLGYDVPWPKIEEALRRAAEKAGLTDPFVQVMDLGDYSVVYRAAGLTDNVRSILTVRSNLRVNMLDCLHEVGIEIMSPAYINMRSLERNAPGAIPKGVAGGNKSIGAAPTDVIFDKADKAQTMETKKTELEELEKGLSELSEDERKLAETKRDRLKAQVAYLEKVIDLDEG